MGLQQDVADLVIAAVQACWRDGTLPNIELSQEPIAVEIEEPRANDDGDFCTSVALGLARRLRDADRARPFAQTIAAALNTVAASSPDTPLAAVSVVGGGYLALYLRPGVLDGVIADAVAAGQDWGRSEGGRGRRALVEYVSANPTVPVTTTHARGGVIGDSIAVLLDATGWAVQREFYVNDAPSSRPLRDFLRAALAHYRHHFGVDDSAPEAADSGAAAAVAGLIAREHGDRFLADTASPAFRETVLRALHARQERDLATLGVSFDRWFSEQSLYTEGAVSRTLAALNSSGFAYMEGEAIWLRAAALGDETDRVLVRADGSPTYLAGDLAYHVDKIERGFDRLVDVWNSDHAGYAGRTRAGLAALGYSADCLQIVFAAPVRVLRDGVEIKSGGTSGGAAQPVTLEDLLSDAEPDTVRFLLLRKPGDTPIDLDLDLAHRGNAPTRPLQPGVAANPLDVVRSAMARCAQRVAGSERRTDRDAPSADRDHAVLARAIAAFPDEVRTAADQLAPDRIARYALHLAGLTGAWIDRREGDRSAASDMLAAAVLTTLTNALRLIGISNVSPYSDAAR